METQLEKNTIHLGICMAGAVSAGAYTAGVIDYLLETLELWEKAKKNGENVPTHDVKISAISGSSAGGIISAMLPKIFCAGERPHVSLNQDQTEEEKAKNILYNTWVNFYLPENKNILDELLSPADIEEHGGLNSLLNSGFKARIAKEVLENTAVESCHIPDYVENDMDVIIGLTNTSGYTYNITFDNNKKDSENAYTVTNHRDLAHFVMTSNYDENNDLHKGKFPYNACLSSSEEMQTVTDAAKGTSAFPIGFTAEKMRRPAHILSQNDLLFKNRTAPLITSKKLVATPVLEANGESTSNSIKSTTEHILVNKNAPYGKILPAELEKISNDPDMIFNTLNLDAGTVNNEPFEHLRAVMEKRYYPKKGENFESENKSDKNFQCSILLIDPLPDTVSSNNFEETSLEKIFSQLFKLLQNQAKFKPDLITDAIDTNDFSKFIIGPRRTANDKKKINGYKALASGVLGAFGGFLNKKYLQHDFYLGRKNCQSFLQHHFVVERDTSNPIFRKSYGNEAMIEQFSYRKGKKEYLPIIPDMRYVKHIGSFDGRSQVEQDQLNVERIINYDDLPKVDESTLSHWRDMIRHRIRVLIWVLFKDTISGKSNSDNKEKSNVKPIFNKFETIAFGLYFVTFKIGGITKTITDIIRNELIEYKLYKK